MTEREACMSRHPAGSARTPVVDGFMEALSEVERCRAVFGHSVVLDTEREWLATTRRAVLRAWNGHAA